MNDIEIDTCVFAEWASDCETNLGPTLQSALDPFDNRLESRSYVLLVHTLVQEALA